MGDSDYEQQIEKISSLMLDDKISINEQDPGKLKKYHDFAKSNYSLTDDDAVQLVFEAFVYLKLKNSDSIDPVKDGNQFGAGFS